MNLGEMKILYGAACFMVGLIVLSPTLILAVELPGGEKFSEFWILGPGFIAQDYPYNVSEGSVYRIHLGVVNSLGDLQYYLVYLKFRNQTEPPPRAEDGTPSPLPPLNEYRILLEDGQNRTQEFDISFLGVTFEANRCTVQSLSISDQEVPLNKTATWSEDLSGYYFQLFFELWSFDESSNDFSFQNRTVWLWLNMTRGA